MLDGIWQSTLTDVRYAFRLLRRERAHSLLVVLTIGLSFLGEGLNDIINPLLKKERS